MNLHIPLGPAWEIAGPLPSLIGPGAAAGKRKAEARPQALGATNGWRVHRAQRGTGRGRAFAANYQDLQCPGLGPTGALKQQRLNELRGERRPRKQERSEGKKVLTPLGDLGLAGAANAGRRVEPPACGPHGARSGGGRSLRGPGPAPPRLRGSDGPAPPPSQAGVRSPDLGAAENTSKAKGSRPDPGAVPAGVRRSRAGPPAREGAGAAFLPFLPTSPPLES